MALRQDIEAIAANAALSDDMKKALIAAVTDEAKAAAADATASNTLHDARRSRWEVPLWIALTGLITFGAQSAYDWAKTGEETEFNREQAERDRLQERILKREESDAASRRLDDEQQFQQEQERLKFQYDVLKSELAKFETAIDRANALRFLVRVKVVGAPLDLAEIDKIVSESKTDPTALPPVGAALPIASFSYIPCATGPANARVTGAALRSISGTPTGRTPLIDPDRAAAALNSAAIGVGLCDAETLSAFIAIAVHETSGMSVIQAVDTRLPEPISKALGNRSADEDVMFAARGFAMVTGRRNYEWLAETLGRADLIAHPEALSQDLDLSAKALAAIIRQRNVFSDCGGPRPCDGAKLWRRWNGGINGVDPFLVVLDRARIELSGE